MPLVATVSGLGCSLNTAHFSLPENSMQGMFGGSTFCTTDVPCKLNSGTLYCYFRLSEGTSVKFWIILSSSFIFPSPCHPPNKIDSPRLVFRFHLSRFDKALHRISPKLHASTSAQLPEVSFLTPWGLSSTSTPGLRDSDLCPTGWFHSSRLYGSEEASLNGFRWF